MLYKLGHGGVWNYRSGPFKVNLCRIILFLSLYSDVIVCVKLLQAIGRFPRVCCAASNVTFFGLIYRWQRVKWSLCLGQLMSPFSMKGWSFQKAASIHSCSYVCLICNRVSHGLCVPLPAVAFGSHCVIIAGCERAGCRARKQSSLIKSCWQRVSHYIPAAETL